MLGDDKRGKIVSANKARAVHWEIAGLLVCLGCVLWWTITCLLSLLTSRHSQAFVPVTSSVRGGPPLKVLYIVTTSNQYDSGERDTAFGSDRLKRTLIPVVREGIESMILSGLEVDLFLICHYNMTRRHLVQEALPPTVGLEIWDDASPLGYKLEDKKHANHIQHITRALARQHRYVVKDKLMDYDLFAVFEDDMLITGDTIRNFVEVTQDLDGLRAEASERLPLSAATMYGDNFFGNLTKDRLQRMIPGFIRVEILLDDQKYGAQYKLDPVPITDRPLVDPNPCCQLRNPLTLSRIRPQNPRSDQLVLWETSIKALGIRKMPSQSKLLDWVVLQRGTREFNPSYYVGDYWSGVDGYYQNTKDKYRPDAKQFRYINNQGGWMATRKQIWEWHTEICPGGFLPPYEDPEYHLDGLDKRNVEYWSGGMSIFTREHGCNLQRLIPLDPDRFARSLLYHTSNNKQKQFKIKPDIMVKVNDFLGQLNTVRKNAEAELQRRAYEAAHGTPR